MDVTTRRMVFDSFYNSGLHGGLWSKIVYVIVKVQYFDKCQYVYAKNTASSHAEIQALSYLEKLLQSDLVNCPTIGLTFYISLSPCQDCSTRIVSFMMKSRMMHGAKLDMKIIFPSLYKIIRPSCIEFGHHNGHHKIPSPEEHERNLGGLIHLTQNGVILETFGDWQWADLARILTVNSLSFVQGQKRLLEDGVLKQDCERLFSPRVDEWIPGTTIEMASQNFSPWSQEFPVTPRFFTSGKVHYSSTRFLHRRRNYEEDWQGYESVDFYLWR